MGEQRNPGDSTSFLVPQVESPVGGCLLVLSVTILVCLLLGKLLVILVFLILPCLS